MPNLGPDPSPGIRETSRSRRVLEGQRQPTATTRARLILTVAAAVNIQANLFKVGTLALVSR
jgi:hypothetical protein